MSGAPALSAVLVSDRFETVAEAVGSLRAQSARDRIELVLVCPDPAALAGREEELEGLHSHRHVEAAVDTLPPARAAGVEAASAPIVAFVETHSFPEPGWAEALIAAHEDGWAAVGPVMVNDERTRSPVGWANFYVDYGRWAEAQPAGPVEDLPGHNSSYKRDVLLSYGSRLGSMLDADTLLHSDLRRRGLSLYLEPAARTHHVSPLETIATIAGWFHYSRGFAAARGGEWAAWRRLLYVAGAPLIPLVRLRRTLAAVRRAGHARPAWAMLPIMLVALIGSAAGEAAGYALGGAGGTEMTRYHLHRFRYAGLGSQDRDAD